MTDTDASGGQQGRDVAVDEGHAGSGRADGADGSPVAGSQTHGGGQRAQRLSRQLILDTAVAFVEERGLANLSMRRLASALNVQAMSLYPHVPGREDLLDGMVETVVDELYSDPEVFLEPRHGWEDYLRRVAYGLRRIAFAHPHLFPLVATRPPAAPWVRPPLRSLRWVNSFLAGLIQSGFSDRSAAATYRAFTSFLLGHLLLDVSGQTVDVTAAADAREGLPAGDQNDGSGGPDNGTPADPLRAYPELRRLQEQLTEDTSDREFEQSLGNLLDRLRDLHRVDNPDDADDNGLVSASVAGPHRAPG